MLTDVSFYLTNILLGVALAMDAFSVSLANGLNEPCMKMRKSCAIAGMFGFFQALMPFLGWVLLKTLVHVFAPLTTVIPWVALALLGFIGGKMLCEGIKNKDCECECGCTPALGFGALVVQGIATSIDALSAGLNFVEYDLFTSLFAALIIAIVTFIICVCGVELGKKTGTMLAGKAGILGGSILIFIGLWIFIKSWF
ncbi:MAG: manganese efflux pump [Clostridia bacterium]|nr:manganese efflux pump [Clostridia bacterium]